MDIIWILRGSLKKNSIHILTVLQMKYIDPKIGQKTRALDF